MVFIFKCVNVDDIKKGDAIKHDLLIAKFYTCGFNKESLKHPHSNLRNRWLRAKINKRFGLK